MLGLNYVYRDSTVHVDFYFCGYTQRAGYRGGRRAHVTTAQTKTLDGRQLYRRADDKPATSFVGIGWGFSGEKIPWWLCVGFVWRWCRAFVNNALCLLLPNNKNKIKTRVWNFDMCALKNAHKFVSDKIFASRKLLGVQATLNFSLSMYASPLSAGKWGQCWPMNAIFNSTANSIQCFNPVSI